MNATARRPRLRHVLTLLLIVGSTTVGTDVVRSGPAAADTVGYCSPAPGATCTVYTDRWIPGSPGGGRGPHEEVPAEGNELAWCRLPNHWQVHWDQSLLHSYFAGAPAGSTLLYIHCIRYADNSEADEWRFGYYEPDDPRAPRPAPAVIGDWLWVGVRAFLYDPAVAANPAPGRPVTVGVPTFVANTTWQNPIWLRDCRFGTCVVLQATPTMTFDPGEPGSEPVPCTSPAGGSRFDPGSDLTPQQQAEAAGACAYTYTQRTGGDRADVWDGQLIVTWDVRWTAGGLSGDLPDIVLTADVPREVHELQANVIDGELE